MSLKIVHVLMIIIIACMLYYVINDINCNCLINGFSVAGSNINITKDLILDGNTCPSPPPSPTPPPPSPPSPSPTPPPPSPPNPTPSPPPSPMPLQDECKNHFTQFMANCGSESLESPSEVCCNKVNNYKPIYDYCKKTYKIGFTGPGANEDKLALNKAYDNCKCPKFNTVSGYKYRREAQYGLTILNLHPVYINSKAGAMVYIWHRKEQQWKFTSNYFDRQQEVKDGPNPEAIKLLECLRNAFNITKIGVMHRVNDKKYKWFNLHYEIQVTISNPMPREGWLHFTDETDDTYEINITKPGKYIKMYGGTNPKLKNLIISTS